jgi:ubiquinone/menaquinone biosynthesis C-methylase UbiE
MQKKLIGPSGQETKLAAPQASLQALLVENARKYDGMSSRYDTDRFEDRFGRYDFTETRLLIQRLVCDLAPQPHEGWIALDVACGTGKTAIAIAQIGRKVIGLDAAFGMLQQCSANSIASNVQSRLNLISASANQLPYRNDSFDLVVAFRFLHLFPVEAYPDLIRDMVRVVKPGGYVVVEFKNHWYAGLPPTLHALRQGNQTANRDSLRLSYVGMKQLEVLAKQVGGIKLEFVIGSLLPKGWRLATIAPLGRTLRQLSNGPLKTISAYLVAVYRKDR